MRIVTDILRVVRLPEVRECGDGMLLVTKNIGMAPDGTMRLMKSTPSTLGIKKPTASEPQLTKGKDNVKG